MPAILLEEDAAEQTLWVLIQGHHMPMPFVATRHFRTYRHDGNRLQLLLRALKLLGHSIFPVQES